MSNLQNRARTFLPDSWRLPTGALNRITDVEMCELGMCGLSCRWVDAGELQVGDDVRQADGTTGEVRSVRVGG